ncbi:MAG: VanZ family protein [Lachnospira sp.]|nr:VanZ family protein [Lachnospira sp.]
MFKKIAVWIPVIVLACFIFGFSAQDGVASGGLSRKVAAFLVDMADATGWVDVAESERDSVIESIQYPVRKLAHMSEYALLTVLTYIALAVDGISKGKRWWLALLGAILFACTDEFHQLFVPGRAGMITDVLIDSVGCIIGVLMCITTVSIKSKFMLDRKHNSVL